MRRACSRRATTAAPPESSSSCSPRPDPGCCIPASAARLLLARAYYHSAQLRRAEETTRSILRDDPVDAYAALLLARTLERSGRRDEAARALALATALGAPGTEQGLDDTELDNAELDKSREAAA